MALVALSMCGCSIWQFDQVGGFVLYQSDIGAFVTALKALAVPGRTLVVLALEVRQLDRIRLFLQQVCVHVYVSVVGVVFTLWPHSPQAEAAGFTVVVEASFSASPSAQHTKSVVLVTMHCSKSVGHS